MSYSKKTHLPCPSCKSSDAFVDYPDGGYCFSCNKATKKDSKGVLKVDASYTPELIIGGSFIPLKNKDCPLTDRGISKETCERFGVKIKPIIDAETGARKPHTMLLPYTNSEGHIIAQKLRSVEANSSNIKHGWVGKSKQPTLFGSNLFTGGGKKICVTEGELDAMAVYEMMGNFPVVSIPNGAASAKKDIANNYQYLDQFDQIILCFDNDEHGTKAAEEVAKILPFGKAVIMSMSKHKDANEYLKAGDKVTFSKEFWGAKEYAPDSIVNGADMYDEFMKEPEEGTTSFPWAGLDEMTFGVRDGELVTLVAGTGVGKSSVLRELAEHLRTTTEHKIGMLMLEETNWRTTRGLVSLHVGAPLHIPVRETRYMAAHRVVPQDELEKAFDTVLGGRRYVFIHDKYFGSNSIDSIIANVEYMVKGLGCKYIILDHLSIIVADQQQGDERKALDEVVTKLKTLANSLKIVIFCACHLKRPDGTPFEEGAQTTIGAIRGSACIAQTSDIIIGCERNQQALTDKMKNTTIIRGLKARISGITGEACQLYLDMSTYRLQELSSEDYKEIVAEENKAKEEGGFAEDGEGRKGKFETFSTFEKSWNKDKKVLETNR